ncbi:hypothetical protein GYMLUDRAFT_47254 [Collybiopsis luxurians FD-317 M1]|uniref:Uncharacterized protein n=1 Tax=Collybiopsis luxurians FD-317 M1 TaxID=944289 RepID=A0A0D0BMR3_9AGAR|nr:hypothetical protein GYMLUDRAFT_47254 [Collybiopsis luxurians FD-317 M1]
MSATKSSTSATTTTKGLEPSSPFFHYHISLPESRPPCPPGSKPHRLSILYIMLLVAISLVTFCGILSEIFLSYAPVILSIVLPHPPTGAEVVRLTETLKVIEFYTRLQASSSTFGALMFVWYKIFLVLIKKAMTLWIKSSIDDSDADSESRRKSSFLSRVYLPLLLAVVIINDSIFNRFSPSLIPSSYASVLADCLPTLMVINVGSVDQAFLLGVLMRLRWMALRALPVCAVEVSLLVSIVYAIGWYTARSRVQNASDSDVEKGMAVPPSMYDDDLIQDGAYDRVMHTYYVPCFDEVYAYPVGDEHRFGVIRLEES